VRRDSAVCIAMGYGPDDRGSISSKSKNDVFLFHSVQTGFGAHPASYPMATGVFLPGGKAARV
jgi:hypothetical protein